MKKYLIAVFLFIFCFLPVFASDVVINSSGSYNGKPTVITNNTCSLYLKITNADPNVNRLRIKDSSGKIFFDAKPSVNDTFYLPRGAYEATAWSSPLHESSNAIVGIFVDEAPVVVQTDTPEVKTEALTRSSVYNNSLDYYGIPYYYNDNRYERPVLPENKDNAVKNTNPFYKNFKPLNPTPKKFYENVKPLGPTKNYDSNFEK